MMQEREREVSILVWTSGYSKMGTRDPDRRERLGCGGKQDQTEVKRFFSATALNLSAQTWFLSVGSPRWSYPTLSLSPSRSLSDFSVPFDEDAFLHHPSFGRGFGYDICRQCPRQCRLPCVERSERLQEPDLVLWSVTLGQETYHTSSPDLGLLDRWIQ